DRTEARPQVHIVHRFAERTTFAESEQDRFRVELRGTDLRGDGVAALLEVVAGVADLVDAEVVAAELGAHVLEVVLARRLAPREGFLGLGGWDQPPLP